MDIEEYVQTAPQTPQDVALPSVTMDMYKQLEELVAATSTRLDDMLLAQQKAALLSQYTAFKNSKPDFDEASFFAAIEAKYNEMIESGATPEQAQAMTDKMYMNPAGWTALYGEMTKTSAPLVPDEILPDVGSTKESITPQRLGAILNQGAKK